MKSVVSLVFACMMLVSCSDQYSDLIDTSYSADEYAKLEVAKVQGQAITLGELDHVLAFHNSSPDSSTVSERKNALQGLIDNEILYQSAVASGFLDDPELKNNMRELVAYKYRAYLEGKVAGLVKVTETEARLSYEANVEKYTQKGMFRLALFERKDNDHKKYKYTLSQIISASEYLDATDGFGEYAFESSHSSTRNRGGKLSWMTTDTRISGIPQSIVETGSKLDVGEVSDVIVVADRKYLIRKIDEKDEEVTPFEEIQSDLTKSLVKKQKEVLYLRQLEEIKKSFEVSIDKSLLSEKSNEGTSSAHTLSPPGFPVQ